MVAYTFNPKAWEGEVVRDNCLYSGRGKTPIVSLLSFHRQNEKEIKVINCLKDTESCLLSCFFPRYPSKITGDTILKPLPCCSVSGQVAHRGHVRAAEGVKISVFLMMIFFLT